MEVKYSKGVFIYNRKNLDFVFIESDKSEKISKFFLRNLDLDKFVINYV